MKKPYKELREDIDDEVKAIKETLAVLNIVKTQLRRIMLQNPRLALI